MCIYNLTKFIYLFFYLIQRYYISVKTETLYICPQDIFEFTSK